jgi:hypothetical protein
MLCDELHSDHYFVLKPVEGKERKVKVKSAVGAFTALKPYGLLYS